MFDDNYRDTGVPLISSVSYQTSNISGSPLDYPIPANLRGGVGFQNTPARAARRLDDRTKRAFVQVDYNQAFTAAGSHKLKAGFGLQHTSNDVDNTYPVAATCSSGGTAPSPARRRA